MIYLVHGGTQVSLRGSSFRCPDDTALEGLLNTEAERLSTTAWPDPELGLAQHMVREFGLRIRKADKRPKPDKTPGRVF